MHYGERCVPLIPEEMKGHGLLSEICEQLLLNHWEFCLNIWEMSLFYPAIITSIWCYFPFIPLLLLPAFHDLSEFKFIQFWNTQPWNTAASVTLGQILSGGPSRLNTRLGYYVSVWFTSIHWNSHKENLSQSYAVIENISIHKGLNNKSRKKLVIMQWAFHGKFRQTSNSPHCALYDRLSPGFTF